MKQRFAIIISILMVVIFMVLCSDDVDSSEQMQEQEEEATNDRFDILDFIAVEGDTLFLSKVGTYATDCRISSQGDTDFFRIDLLGIDSIELSSQTIANKFRLGFQGGIPESKVWEVQHLPKGNPDTWDAKYATVLIDMISEDCENLNLIASEGMVETKRVGDELFIFIDEVLVIDHELENDVGCGFRVSGKFSCEL